MIKSKFTTTAVTYLNTKHREDTALHFILQYTRLHTLSQTLVCKNHTGDPKKIFRLTYSVLGLQVHFKLTGIAVAIQGTYFENNCSTLEVRY